MKAPLRPFEYMAWAHDVPVGARYDLSSSGVSDAVLLQSPDSPWFGQIGIEEQCRRDRQEQAIADFASAVAQRYEVDPEFVTPTLGASLAITHVLMALVRAGDHVIVERPTYEALHRVPEILGASVSRLERKFDEGWEVLPDRLAQLLTPKTRAVVLSNLHNPSGVALPRESISTVADLTSRVGGTLLVDEVYLDYAWDPTNHPPACLVADNAVSWSSTTKCFGFSALRAGWIVTRSEEASRAIRAAASYLHVHMPIATARLGIEVLSASAELTARAQTVARAGRAVLESWISRESRVSWIAPAAGICACLKLPELLQDLAFAEHLRGRYDTQVVPGSMFEAPGFVRVGFGGAAPPDLEQGLANFSAALDDLVG